MTVTSARAPRLILAACLLALVAGCGADKSAENADQHGARVDMTPPALPAANADSIQVQPGPRGTLVHLSRASVTNEVLTVQLVYNQAGGDYGDIAVTVPIAKATIVDEALAQSYSVLNDGKGRWVAGPKDPNDKNELAFTVGKQPAMAWFRFPAPPPGSHDITISIPGVALFENVDVAR